LSQHRLIHPRGYKAGEKATAHLKALQMRGIEFPITPLLGRWVNKASGFTATPKGNKGVVALGKAEDVPTDGGDLY
jgi:hypothetical protein